MTHADAPANPLALAASALVGAPFRLHGRDPRMGLDCLGVLAASLAMLGRPADLPGGYPLRRLGTPDTSRLAARLGLEPASGAPLPGDVLLARVGACQLHLAIAVSAHTVVHAHAGLRKVVLGPLPPEWTLAGHWRLPPPPLPPTA